MPRIVDAVTRSLYVLSGVIYVLVGGGVMLLGTGLLPASVHDWIIQLGKGDPDTLHLIQEWGTLCVFVGALLLWFARHYERSIKFHWAVTFYMALDAWIHWFNPHGQFENKPRAIINAIPFVVFLGLGLLRRMQPDARTESKRAVT